MAENLPTANGEHTPGRRTLVTFLVALLAAVGLGSAVEWWQRRQQRIAGEHEQQAAAEYRAEMMRKAEAGHEPNALRSGRVALAAGALVAIIVAGGVAIWLLVGFLEGRAERADVPRSPLATPGQPPPAPRLQADPVAEWQTVRATAQAVLNGYGPSGGGVHIPIDRAMDLVAQRGLPARAATPPPFGDDTAHNLESSGGQPPGATPTAGK